MLRSVGLIETTPALFYAVTWGWTHAFGHSEFMLRAVSALAGIAVVPVAFLYGRRLAGERAAGSWPPWPQSTRSWSGTRRTRAPTRSPCSSARWAGWPSCACSTSRARPMCCGGGWRREPRRSRITRPSTSSSPRASGCWRLGHGSGARCLLRPAAWPCSASRSVRRRPPSTTPGRAGSSSFRSATARGGGPRRTRRSVPAHLAPGSHRRRARSARRPARPAAGRSPTHPRAGRAGRGRGRARAARARERRRRHPRPEPHLRLAPAVGPRRRRARVAAARVDDRRRSRRGVRRAARRDGRGPHRRPPAAARLGSGGQGDRRGTSASGDHRVEPVFVAAARLLPPCARAPPRPGSPPARSSS